MSLLETQRAEGRAAIHAAVVMTVAGLVLGLAGCSTSSKKPSETAGVPERKTPSTTTMPTIAPDRLDSILLTSGEANAIMGASEMQPYTEIFHRTDNSGRTLSNSECLGARWPATGSWPWLHRY
jgi:hypothetical protein